MRANGWFVSKSTSFTFGTVLALYLLSYGTGSLVASFILHAAFYGFSTLTLILVALNPPPLDREVVPLPQRVEVDDGGDLGVGLR